MGIYLNPENHGFRESINSAIYVDKTEMIAYTNQVLGTEQKFICVSRPRRFGKSMTAEMLVAYYGKGCDSAALFEGLKISRNADFQKNLNKYNVIFLNIQEFFSRTHDVNKMKQLLEKSLTRDLLREYPGIDVMDKEDLISVLQDVYYECKIPFVFIIDEWDCIFRENKNSISEQEVYLDFLRNLLKDKSYVALAYMTGILPIKKYGTHSSLNMFDEFSMTNPRQLAEYVGFTEDEVRILCEEYKIDFEETKRWYDGYQFKGAPHIYSPRSVVSVMLGKCFDNYWNQTETFEALKSYIVMNYDGLRDTVVELLAGEQKEIDTRTFTNDMTTFHSADDVLTLLVHLGYLGYRFDTSEVFIPNSEVASEFYSAVMSAGWDEVVNALSLSEKLLEATWKQDADAVAAAIEKVHLETSILKYNDENALSCTISLAYYSARRYYMQVREMPAGKGYADIVFLPRKNHPDKPALLVELKWNKSAESAIRQIEEKKYVNALKDYSGDLLLVGINYDKENKKHECVIKSWDI